LLVFNDNFKISSICDWNIWTSSKTSFNITWFTASSVDLFVSERFDWLGTFCTVEIVTVVAGITGLTIDTLGTSTNNHQ
jgi:hypothetical protein